MITRAVGVASRSWSSRGRADIYRERRECVRPRTAATTAPLPLERGRRFHVRCELDAAFFHLYGIARDDIDDILETFPIVKRKDVKRHGEYRTKRTILRIHGAMQEAIATGDPYRSAVDPPDQCALSRSVVREGLPA